MEVEFKRDLRGATGVVSSIPEGNYALSTSTKPIVLELATEKRLTEMQYVLDQYASWLRITGRNVEATGALHEYMLHCSKVMGPKDLAKMAKGFVYMARNSKEVADHIKRDGGKLEIINETGKVEKVPNVVDDLKMRKETYQLRGLFVESLKDSDLVLDLGSGGGVLRTDLIKVGKFTRVLSMDLKDPDVGTPSALHVKCDFNAYLAKNPIMCGVTVVYMGHSVYHMDPEVLRSLEVQCDERGIRMVVLTAYQWTSHESIKLPEVSLLYQDTTLYSGMYYNRLLVKEHIYTLAEWTTAGYLKNVYGRDDELKGLGVGLFERGQVFDVDGDDVIVTVPIVRVRARTEDLRAVASISREPMVLLSNDSCPGYYVSHKIDGEQIIMVVKSRRIFFLDRMNNYYESPDLSDCYDINDCVIQCEALKMDKVEDTVVALFPVAIIQPMRSYVGYDFLECMLYHVNVLTQGMGYRVLNLKSYRPFEGLGKVKLPKPHYPIDGVIFTAPLTRPIHSERLVKITRPLNFYSKPLRSYDIQTRRLQLMCKSAIYVRTDGGFEELKTDLIKRETKLAAFTVVELSYLPPGRRLAKLVGPCYVMLHGRVDKFSFDIMHDPKPGDLLKLTMYDYELTLDQYVAQLSPCRFDPSLKKDMRGLTFDHVFEPLMAELTKKGFDTIAGKLVSPIQHDGDGGLEFFVRYDWLVKTYRHYGLNRELHEIIQILEGDNSVQSKTTLRVGVGTSLYEVERAYYKRLTPSDCVRYKEIYKSVVPQNMWAFRVTADDLKNEQIQARE